MISSAHVGPIAHQQVGYRSAAQPQPAVCKLHPLTSGPSAPVLRLVSSLPPAYHLQPTSSSPRAPANQPTRCNAPVSAHQRTAHQLQPPSHHPQPNGPLACGPQTGTYQEDLCESEFWRPVGGFRESLKISENPLHFALWSFGAFGPLHCIYFRNVFLVSTSSYLNKRLHAILPWVVHKELA